MLMTKHYTAVTDLATHQAMPDAGILSRTIHADARVKAVLFSFDADQELSEHTASMPAIIQVVSGDCRLTLGDDVLEAGPGTWVHMEAGLRHGLLARTPVVMLLLLLKSGADPAARPSAEA
jgi:quercetin dioxygenase-like cupin family protein